MNVQKKSSNIPATHSILITQNRRKSNDNAIIIFSYYITSMVSEGILNSITKLILWVDTNRSQYPKYSRKFYGLNTKSTFFILSKSLLWTISSFAFALWHKIIIQFHSISFSDISMTWLYHWYDGAWWYSYFYSLYIAAAIYLYGLIYFCFYLWIHNKM